MEIKYTADPVRFSRMTTNEIRDNFLLSALFVKDKINLFYTDVDRAIVGGIVPGRKELTLSGAKELASEYFAQRREIGIINVGAKGEILVDGKSFSMDPLDGLYVGRSSKEISFRSNDNVKTANFYLLSYPAHTSFPTTHAKKADAEPVNLGSVQEANKRTIYKYIHPNGIKSCQLVMGFTQLDEGSVWNTMPAHTHERRTEVYLYFDVKKESRVFHLMGTPDETRHIILKDKEAVISPSWSLHSGVGTGNYSFIWGMGGENQEFDDMDFIKIEDLK